MSGYFGSNCHTVILNSTIFQNSAILTDEQSAKLVNLITSNNQPNISANQTWKLIYQASVDGFSASTFHSKVDGIQGTLSVVKTINQSSSFIFGGYTQADWNGYYACKYDANAFIFSLTNSYNVSVKMNVTNPANAIYASPNYLINFGSFEFYIYDGGSGYSYNLGSSYKLPSFLTTYGSAQSFLAGTSYFKPVEIEVYSQSLNGMLSFFPK